MKGGGGQTKTGGIIVGGIPDGLMGKCTVELEKWERTKTVSVLTPRNSFTTFNKP